MATAVSPRLALRQPRRIDWRALFGIFLTLGAVGGSISWSSQDLVVLSTALEPPVAGQRYACWLVEGSGSASMIGQMYFAGHTAYWVGSLDQWATFRIGPTTRFAVTLQQPGSTVFSGPIYLSADLGA